MTREVLRKQWQRRMKAYTRSGLSQRAWCEQEGIGLAQFGYRRRQFAESIDRETVIPAIDESFWCPLELAVDKPSNILGLTVPVGQACIEVQPSFDAKLLRAVVQALDSEAPPC